MARIKGEMKVMDVVAALGEGDAGATAVLIDILARTEGPNTASFTGAAVAIELMDELGIYGPRIWMLYRDVCKGDLKAVVAIMAAYVARIEGFSAEIINHAIDNRGEGLDAQSANTVIREWIDGTRKKPDMDKDGNSIPGTATKIPVI